MFKKPNHDPNKLKEQICLDQSDFIKLEDFMKDEKFKNYMDQEERKKMIKNTLDIVIQNKIKALNINERSK
jgi:hypothetical protein